MKRTTTRAAVIVALIGVMGSLYGIYASCFGGVYAMSDEQYAEEAQEIVNYTPSPCRFATGQPKNYQSKMTSEVYRCNPM